MGKKSYNGPSTRVISGEATFSEHTVELDGGTKEKSQRGALRREEQGNGRLAQVSLAQAEVHQVDGHHQE